MIPNWTLFPFTILLLMIALMPLLAAHFWESNRTRAILVGLVSAPVLFWLASHMPHELIHSLKDYVSFIILLGSLYIISGGIALIGDLRATPLVNTAFLGTGAVLANLIGTTGASMVLIRALLKTNSEREHTSHLPVFFIFIVSNIGGLLTPLGDPPLFLGYLQGVPFFWTFKLFPVWLFANGTLLAIFYIWDSLAYKRETAGALQRDEQQIEPLKIKGRRNLLILAGVMYGVFLPSPWRELFMIHMSLISLFVGPTQSRRINQFNWAPLIEVTILFAGIFITMVPAMIFLREHAASVGLVNAKHFFWATGLLSGLLDNAPTYLTFLTVAQGLNLSPEIIGVPTDILVAISLGAVLMGANTYIGNGPNFMVRSIAENAGYKTPSFFGYMIYSILILFPLYGLIHLIFLS